jgi:ethanolamine utilization protein EutQ (cupin superfamily)
MSGYNFDFAVSATISKSVVEEMIRKVVEEQTGRKVASVTFKHCETGGYMDRGSYTVFDGCTVTFAKDSSASCVHYGDR